MVTGITAYKRSIPVKQQITGLQKMSATYKIMIVNWPVDKSSFKGDTHK